MWLLVLELGTDLGVDPGLALVNHKVPPVPCSLGRATVSRGSAFLISVSYNNTHIFIMKGSHTALAVDFASIRLDNVVDWHLALSLSLDELHILDSVSVNISQSQTRAVGSTRLIKLLNLVSDASTTHVSVLLVVLELLLCGHLAAGACAAVESLLLGKLLADLAARLEASNRSDAVHSHLIKLVFGVV